MEKQTYDYEVMFQCPIYCEESRAQCKEPVMCGINLMEDSMEFVGACPHVNAPIGSSVRARLEGEAEYLANVLDRETVAERREAVYGKEALPPLRHEDEGEA